MSDFESRLTKRQITKRLVVWENKNEEEKNKECSVTRLGDFVTFWATFESH